MFKEYHMEVGRVIFVLEDELVGKVKEGGRTTRSAAWTIRTYSGESSNPWKKYRKSRSGSRRSPALVGGLALKRGAGLPVGRSRLNNASATTRWEHRCSCQASGLPRKRQGIVIIQQFAVAIQAHLDERVASSIVQERFGSVLPPKEIIAHFHAGLIGG